MTQTIDLSRFCDPELQRYALAVPWRSGEYVRATDGRALIQVDANLAPTAVEPAGRVPAFEDILDRLESITNWQPCPAVPNCEECQDSGKKYAACRRCFGGTHECDCGHEHECGHCDGDGLIFDKFCEACEFHFANRQLQHTYMLVVAKLPNCELGTISDEPGDNVFFRFTGGMGAICPLYHDKDK